MIFVQSPQIICLRGRHVLLSRKAVMKEMAADIPMVPGSNRTLCGFNAVDIGPCALSSRQDQYTRRHTRQKKRGGGGDAQYGEEMVVVREQGAFQSPLVNSFRCRIGFGAHGPPTAGLRRCRRRGLVRRNLVRSGEHKSTRRRWCGTR